VRIARSLSVRERAAPSLLKPSVSTAPALSLGLHAVWGGRRSRWPDSPVCSAL